MFHHYTYYFFLLLQWRESANTTGCTTGYCTTGCCTTDTATTSETYRTSLWSIWLRKIQLHQSHIYYFARLPRPTTTSLLPTTTTSTATTTATNRFSNCGRYSKSSFNQCGWFSTWSSTASFIDRISSPTANVSWRWQWWYCTTTIVWCASSSSSVGCSRLANRPQSLMLLIKV